MQFVMTRNEPQITSYDVFYNNADVSDPTQAFAMMDVFDNATTHVYINFGRYEACRCVFFGQYSHRGSAEKMLEEMTGLL